MSAKNGSSTFYKMNAMIPPELVAPLLHMLQKSGGHSFELVSEPERPAPKRHGKVPAKDVILETLRDGSPLYRGELRQALELSGHSPHSVGPICTMLQKDGRIHSPRRGFWQIRV